MKISQSVSSNSLKKPLVKEKQLKLHVYFFNEYSVLEHQTVVCYISFYVHRILTSWYCFLDCKLCLLVHKTIHFTLFCKFVASCLFCLRLGGGFLPPPSYYIFVFGMRIL
ncbi:hypothetical protein LguiA_001067 [Lonicera macranthoides]